MNQLKQLMMPFMVFMSLILSACSQATPPALAPTSVDDHTAPNQAAAGTPAHNHEAEENSPDQIKDQNSASQVSEQVEIEMPHIHGLGFSADGRQLFVAAHDGLRVFSEGQWSIPDLPAHDYMGYVATDDGFYSSGHPHPSSGLINPFGLIKSSDGGQTLTRLGFEGESDFHLMGVGYQNHAIYVFNPSPNSRLSAGIHYSLDDGQTWQQSALQGLSANPIQIAVHPVEANRMALATEAGLLLSADYGNTLKRIGDEGVVTAVTFASEGDRLLFGAQSLFSYDLSDEQITPLSTPAIAADDAIAYITINPAQSQEIVLATFQRHIYRSMDGGQSWTQIAEAGRGFAK